MRIAICFLVINRIRELPAISISSALERTSADIKVGYVNQEDIQSLPQSPRIECLDLTRMSAKTEDSIKQSTGSYVSFDQDDFFELVRMKWRLFTEILNEYDAILYSDVDVIWLQDVHSVIAESFAESPETDVFV